MPIRIDLSGNRVADRAGKICQAMFDIYRENGGDLARISSLVSDFCKVNAWCLGCNPKPLYWTHGTHATLLAIGSPLLGMISGGDYHYRITITPAEAIIERIDDAKKN